MMSLENYSTMDPFILLSAVNMQLRDEYPSLEELCKVHDINQHELVKKLKAAGFEYVKEINQFK
ncbi:DUF4250 domain-containing protein [Succinivibrio dextrinosolvens]|uniref:DUF4250 domain-containing protein n=1 Tax=Succinivibrio dextrinosolvens TaxID=83771 RepID=UPI0018CC3F3E|nr:DUF4250 domain-containing protein [Succinivibrio dextrinosolvens]